VILAHVSPAAVLTTDKGDILYIRGRTGNYLEPPVGKANLNVFTMAREGLRHELGAAFSSALRQERPVTVRGVRVINNGSSQLVDLQVQKLAEPRELRGTVMIVITDAPVCAPVALCTRAPGSAKRAVTMPSKGARRIR
jgi:two-component system, chemotaxis family, CheB/CheR fusion protein